MTAGHAIGREVPIGCDRGWRRRGAELRYGDCVRLGRTVLGRYGQGEGVGPEVEVEVRGVRRAGVAVAGDGDG